MEIFTANFISNASLLYKYAKYVPYLLSIITFWLGLKLKFGLADRQFLRTEIYIPLYQDIKLISKNISDYENIYSTRSGQVSPMIGKVRNSLIDTGKYNSIPKKLRKEIDSYYDRCEEYNKLFNSARKEITEICINEIRKIKTKEDDEKFLNESRTNSRKVSWTISPKFLLMGDLPNPLPQLNDHHGLILTEGYEKWDGKITIDDLNRNSLSLKDLLDKFIKSVGKNDNVTRFRELQNQLKNSEKLLKRINKRIQNPNLLVEKLGI